MVSGWGMTDRGIVRRENQDSCAYEILADGALAWGVVCDGMGGAKAGDVASKMAVEAFCTQMDQLKDLEGPPPAENLLQAAAEDANRVVYLKAQTDDDCIGMGTTLVGLILQGTALWVVNVGDSRAYRVSQGEIHRITRDHSVVEDLVARGDLILGWGIRDLEALVVNLADKLCATAEVCRIYHYLRNRDRRRRRLAAA